MLAFCGKIDDRDEDGNETGVMASPESVAWSLRMSDKPEDLAAFNEAMREFDTRGMAKIHNGIIWLPNYGDRQGHKPSDEPERIAERVKRHRSIKPTQSTKDVTPCNADVTPMKRPVTRSDTDIDSDTDTDVDVDAAARKNDDDNGAALSPESRGVSNAVRAWEQANGRLVTEGDSKQLSEMIDTYTAEWVTDAIWEANKSKQGRMMNLAFVEAFLKRWQTEGYKAPRDSPKADDSARKRELAQQTRKELLRDGIPRERVDAAIREQFGEGF